MEKLIKKTKKIKKKVISKGFFKHLEYIYKVFKIISIKTKRKGLKQLVKLKNFINSFRTLKVQDSFLFASMLTISFKILFTLFFDYKPSFIVVIFVLVELALFNYITDYYWIIWEKIYNFLVFAMGPRALFPYHINSFMNFYLQQKYIKLEDKISHKIVRFILTLLFYIRLIIISEPLIFICVHFLVAYFLLANKFLLSAYFISALLISSRICFFITDFNMKFYKEGIKSLNNLEKLLNDEDLNDYYYILTPKWETATILVLWAFRCENTGTIFSEEDYYYRESHWESYLRYIFVDKADPEDLLYADWNSQFKIYFRLLNLKLNEKFLFIRMGRGKLLAEMPEKVENYYGFLFLFVICPIIISFFTNSHEFVYDFFILGGSPIVSASTQNQSYFSLITTYVSAAFWNISIYQKETVRSVILSASSYIQGPQTKHPSLFIYDYQQWLLKQVYQSTPNPQSIYSFSNPRLFENNGTYQVINMKGYLYKVEKERQLLSVLTSGLEFSKPFLEKEHSHQNFSKVATEVENAPLHNFLDYFRVSFIKKYFPDKFELYFKTTSPLPSILVEADIFYVACYWTTEQRILWIDHTIHFHLQMSNASESWANNTDIADHIANLWKIKQSFYKKPHIWDELDRELLERGIKYSQKDNSLFDEKVQTVLNKMNNILQEAIVNKKFDHDLSYVSDNQDSIHKVFEHPIKSQKIYSDAKQYQINKNEEIRNQAGMISPHDKINQQIMLEKMLNLEGTDKKINAKEALWNFYEEPQTRDNPEFYNNNFKKNMLDAANFQNAKDLSIFPGKD